MLEFQVAIPVNYQQQLDMVSFRVAGRLHHNEAVRNGAEKEWDLISLGESEWGGAYTLGMNRHKKTPYKKIATKFCNCYNMVCRSHTERTKNSVNVLRSLKFPVES